MLGYFIIPGLIERPLKNEFARLGVIVHVEKPQLITPVAAEEKMEINYDEQSAWAKEFQDKIWNIVDSTKSVNLEFINRFLNQYK